MSKVGAQKKALRKAVEFEFNPPQCVNCSHFKPPSHGVPGRKFYRAPHCILHHFQVKPHSICNDWVGLAGEVLEAA